MTPRQEELLRASLDRVLNDFPGAIDLAAVARSVQIGRLSTLSGTQVCGGGERIAGVLVRFAGRFPKVGLFGMEPETAFELVRDDRGGGDPMSVYTGIGCELVRAAAAVFDPLGVRQEGNATLREDSLVGTLLDTHAPFDTGLVSVQLTLSWVGAEASHAAHVYLLADPKPFAAAVGAV